MIKIIQTLDELDNFKAFWDSLYASDDFATPFQKFDYIRLSLADGIGATGHLYIITLKDDASNTWSAIFPFVLDSGGILRFINETHSDFCCPIIHPDFRHFNLFKELSEYISQDKKIKGLCLKNIPFCNPFLAVLKPHFPYLICQDFNYYSTIPIIAKDNDKDEIDAFRFVLAKQRNNLRKMRKRGHSDCSFEILSSNEGNPYPLEEIKALASRMISDGKRVRDYFSDSFMEFWEKLYEKGLLSVAVLRRGDEVLSCNFMFPDKKHKEYIKWLMLYTENQWNMVINILIAEHIYHSDDIGGINFARGIYDYKLTNFHPDVKALFCLRIAKTRWGHIRNMLAVAIHYVKPVVKSFLRR